MENISSQDLSLSGKSEPKNVGNSAEDLKLGKWKKNKFISPHECKDPSYGLE